MQGKKGPQWTEITKPAIIVGRHKLPIPPDEVELMASIGCTDREIATYFGLAETTFRTNFSDYLINGRQQLKSSLRRAQLQTALSGNATLLIWLGKQCLGQTENPSTSDERKPLPWTDDFDDNVLELDDVETTTEENNG
jgi:hypothetical protein